VSRRPWWEPDRYEAARGDAGDKGTIVWFEMRKESLGFLGRAAVVHVAEAEIAAPRNAVFGALAEPQGWKHWFPGVREASYTTPPPYGVGTIREANVGGTRWVEELIAWEDPTRWAWTVLGTSVPFAWAQVELFEFVEAAGLTRVQWTLALEPRLLARLGAPLAGPMISRVLRHGMENLAAYLARSGSSERRTTGR
jgi:carbon monoxide dehydrogenase subunit G